MPTTEMILDSIENRLRDLNTEIDTLTAARAALEPRGRARRVRQRSTPSAAPNGQAMNANPAATAAEAIAPESRQAATPPRTRTARRSRRGGRDRKGGRSVEVVAAGKLELLLSKADGATTSELARQANGDRDQVLLLLREMEAAGRVRRSGQRRGTRWHVITDEDRIAQRAAELAAMSRSSA